MASATPPRFSFSSPVTPPPSCTAGPCASAASSWRAPPLALALSVLLYAVTWELGRNLPAYPSGDWFFNPFAWQLLFVFGSWCALGGAERLGCVLHSPVTTAIAVAYLLFAFAITLT